MKRFTRDWILRVNRFTVGTPELAGIVIMVALQLDKSTRQTLLMRQAYIDVHSVNYPTGEIRGQVIPVKGK